MRTLSLLMLFGLLASAQEYKPGPDSLPQPGVPVGKVTKHVLAPGKYYPGTPHNYQVYVPAQYDASKPTPFMIYLDGGGAVGNGMRVPTVFDNLIAKKDIPPMIGIFIDPGVLPVVNPEAMNRFERVFEYDSLSDRFASFLIDEVIPEVSKSYNLSKDPNDRGLSGNSTGAVGAFMAAWNRPDQFRRVLSFIGTFVSMKGADAMPALIRKTEPKPIRVHLQAGKNDHLAADLPFGTFYAGSWPVNNQVMFEALSYSGYDVKFELGNGGHDGKQTAAIMPDALRWLWRGYPAPITVKEPAHMKAPGYDPRGKVYSMISAAKQWELVADNAAAPAPDSQGNIYFFDFKASQIKKTDGVGNTTVFKNNIRANSMATGPDGRIYVATDQNKIIALDSAGNEKPVASGIHVTGMAIAQNGRIYTTDAAAKLIQSVEPGGKVQNLSRADEFGTPFGITLSPDQAMAVVTDVQGRFSWSFQIAKDGKLVNGEPFYRLELPEAGDKSGVSATAVDNIGQVYFATLARIQVCEANGRVAAILNSPDRNRMSYLTFGGKDMNFLYVVDNFKLYRREMKVSGAGSWMTLKLPKPPL